jgi:hypothetical protein
LKHDITKFLFDARAPHPYSAQQTRGARGVREHVKAQVMVETKAHTLLSPLAFFFSFGLDSMSIMQPCMESFNSPLNFVLRAASVLEIHVVFFFLMCRLIFECIV